MPEANHSTPVESVDISVGISLWRSRIRSSEVSRAISRDAETIVAKYQSGWSQKSIAAEYGIRPAAISDFLTKIGVEKISWADSHRKYALNQSAFDEITEESAYWAGFLMADGCVSDGKNGQFVLSLDLADRDAGHVEKFRQFLGSGQKVRMEKKPESLSTIRGRPVRSTGHARILITSRQLVESLSRFGVAPRKSFTAKVVGLEGNAHFWRGVVDGDGWITGHDTTLKLAIVGSLAMTEQFRSFVKSLVPGFAAVPSRTKSNIYSIGVTGRGAQSVIRHLYTNSVISLDRKQILADAAIQTTFVDYTLPVREGMIKTLRVQRGLNQREAAKLAGMHFTYWNMVERNHRGIYSRVTRPTIEKFCKALDCDAGAILAA
jgi:DNA-binding Xre family transcriptional regulator